MVNDPAETLQSLLRDAGIEFEALELNRQYTDRSLRAVAAVTSLPQVFINGEHIGGADELEAWLESADVSGTRTAA